MTEETGHSPAPSFDAVIAHHEALAEEERDSDDLRDEALRVIEAARRAGAVTWGLPHREQLQDVIAYWTAVLNDRFPEDFFATPDVEPYSGDLPRLEKGSPAKVLELADAGQPIVALRLQDEDLREIAAPKRKKVLILDCAFVECDFRGARLRNARLVHTTFTRCRFDGADMRGVVASSSIFGRCRLDGVKARGGTFSGTRFDETSMDDGGFEWTSFTAAGLRTLSARGARFGNAIFDQASLERDVDFRSADFRKALFMGATVHSSFPDANLRLSVFSSTTVHGADFRGANLREASFLHARDAPFARWDRDAPRRAQFREDDATAIRATPRGDAA